MVCLAKACFMSGTKISFVLIFDKGCSNGGLSKAPWGNATALSRYTSFIRSYFKIFVPKISISFRKFVGTFLEKIFKTSLKKFKSITGGIQDAVSRGIWGIIPDAIPREISS